MKVNNISNTDSYKASHFLQYPENTLYNSAYIEARGVSSSFPKVDRTVFFGLQAYIKEYLMQKVYASDIDEAEKLFLAHGLPFNRKGWERIVEKHEGYLPLHVSALPEGSVVPLNTPLVQVVNTDPELPWLTSYVETALLRSVWYPTTVATLSWHVKQRISGYLQITADDQSGLEFMLHDFGARGATTEEAAALGGLAHLINFKGTDTVSALIAGNRYYDSGICGFSIPAAEHSTITSWGKENESKAYANMINKFGTGMYAVVSDSYDIYNAADKIWGSELKQKVIDAGGRAVIRPDSGDPVTVVTKVLDILKSRFGYTVNSKGFMVLPSYVRIIQGDGVNPDSIREILREMVRLGYSVENVAFGMGGALLQRLDRDSLKFAMKTSAVFIDNEWKDVYKEPVTDKGKQSKRGRLAVDENYKTYRAEDFNYSLHKNLLQSVYLNGYIERDEDFKTIRERANKG